MSGVKLAGQVLYHLSLTSSPALSILISSSFLTSQGLLWEKAHWQKCTCFFIFF
jgi:hypothetical protein